MHRLLIVVFPLVLAAFGVAFAEPKPAQGRYFAVLIGMGDYQHFGKIPVARNDVAVLKRTLETRAGYRAPDGMSITIIDQPSAKVRDELQRFLKQPKEKDHLLLYFTGHGFRNSKGELFLATVDFALDRPAETGVAVDWLKERLGECKAGTKVVLLDCCRNDPRKAANIPAQATGGAIGKQLTGAVTIAGCEDNQVSQVWTEKGESLFSFYLARGLRGHADSDRDNIVSADELYKFVHDNVARVAKNYLQIEQTPVRTLHDVAGDPPVTALKPYKLPELLEDIAERLAFELQLRKVKKVAVLDFFHENADGQDVLGGRTSAFCRHCGRELRTLLEAKSDDAFLVLPYEQTLQGLDEVPTKDLGKPAALKGVAKALSGTAALVKGVLRSQQGRHASLDCSVVWTESTDNSLRGGGTALLNENEWAALGKSAAILESERPGPKPFRDPAEQVIEKLEAKAQQPQLSPDDPTRDYPVSIYINGTGPANKRNLVRHGNEFLVPVTKGEKLAIGVGNHTDRVVLMRLLVDGLNTLPESPKYAANKAVGVEDHAQPVSLAEAHPWVLDPKKARDFDPIDGFATKTGQKGMVREFVVGDVAESFAARAKFTKDIGMITAAFYRAENPDAARSVAIVPGNTKEVDLTHYDKNIEVGALLDVIHIRYIDAAELKKMQKE